MSESGRHRALGTLQILASALLFGCFGIWSRLMGPHFGIFFQGWTRSLLVVLLLLPLVLARGVARPVARGDLGWFAAFLVITAGSQSPLYYAYNHMDIGTAVLLFYVSMLLTMYALGMALLGERLDRVKAFALVTACAGLYTIFSFSTARFSVLPAAMAVLNGVASGASLALAKKLGARHSSLYLVTWGWFALFAFSLPASLACHEPQVAPALTLPWLYLVALALSGLLAFWFVVAGLRHVEASVGGLLGLSEIVFGVAAGILFFHERLTVRVALGGALIALASAAPQLGEMLEAGSRAGSRPA